MPENSSVDLPQRIQMVLDGTAPPPPIAQLLGLNLVSIGHGEAVFEFEADHRHANPMGSLHGGVLCDLADGAMGIAYATRLQEGETFTTLELKINFLKPVWKSRLRAEARCVSNGKNVGLVTCDIFDDKERLVAKAGSTCMTLRGEQADGR